MHRRKVILLATIILVATVSVSYDYTVSLRRGLKYGVSSELNPVISRLAPHVGLQSAMLSWTLVPHSLFTGMCAFYNWRLAYMFYTGFVLKQALIQLASVPLEVEIDKLGRSRTPPTPRENRPD